MPQLSHRISQVWNDMSTPCKPRLEIIYMFFGWFAFFIENLHEAFPRGAEIIIVDFLGMLQVVSLDRSHIMFSCMWIFSHVSLGICKDASRFTTSPMFFRPVVMARSNRWHPCAVQNIYMHVYDCIHACLCVYMYMWKSSIGLPRLLRVYIYIYFNIAILHGAAFCGPTKGHKSRCSINRHFGDVAGCSSW